MIAKSIELICKEVGGQTALAELLVERMGQSGSLTSMAITQWKVRESVPSKYISALVHLSKGSVKTEDLLKRLD